MNWHELWRPEFVWTVIGLVLLLAEFALPGVVIGFFGAGALGVGAICYLTELSLHAQLLLFLILSVGMMASLRSLLTRSLAGTQEDGDVQDVVGESARVIQAITPEAGGRVEFHGSPWQAQATEAIPRGATVAIVGRDNLTLQVKAVTGV